jgi:hypothetical protein
MIKVVPFEKNICYNNLGVCFYVNSRKWIDWQNPYYEIGVTT